MQINDLEKKDKRTNKKKKKKNFIEREDTNLSTCNK